MSISLNIPLYHKNKKMIDSNQLICKRLNRYICMFISALLCVSQMTSFIKIFLLFHRHFISKIAHLTLTNLMRWDFTTQRTCKLSCMVFGKRITAWLPVLLVLIQPHAPRPSAPSFLQRTEDKTESWQNLWSFRKTPAFLILANTKTCKRVPKRYFSGASAFVVGLSRSISLVFLTLPSPCGQIQPASMAP